MLKATVTQVSNGMVIMTFGNGQTLNVSLEDIEGTPAVGSVVHLIIVAPGSEDAGRQKFAKDLLNEVMGRE